MPFTPPNAGGFRTLARANRRRLSTWPKPAARIIHQVRNAQRQAQLVEHVEAEVHHLAEVRGLVIRAQSGPHRTIDLLPEDVRVDLLRMVLERPGFLRHLDREARRLLREDHLHKRLFPERGLRLIETFGGSPLVLRGSSRFNGVEAAFESMNVGLAAAIGNRFKATVAAPTQPDELVLGRRETTRVSKRVTVLSWHCGVAGTLSVVLDFLKPRDRHYAVVEVDAFSLARDRETSTQWSGAHRVTVFQREDGSCFSTSTPELHWRDPLVKAVRSYEGPVVERRYSFPLIGPWRPFDRVVLDMPPPGEGIGSQLRNSFKRAIENGARRFDERELVDPGRLGPRRWLGLLDGYLRRLPELLNDNGEAIVIVPAGVRHARGYRFHAGLVEHLDRKVEEAGLVVVEDFWVVEEDAIPQPFVGRSRPERRVIIARRAS